MSLDHLFDDCHRRAGIQAQREGAVDLARLWAGLGYPSEFKGKAALYFEPVFKDRLTPRILHWFKLTAAGRDEYLRRYAGKPAYFEKVEQC